MTESSSPVVLGLDAATPPASVALVRGGEVLASTTGPFGPQTDAWILDGIESVLETAGLSLAQLDRIASSIGPGTFTGIRVGIATAAGLARGIGAATVGVTTLEALVEATGMAAESAAGQVLAVVDARRGQLYAALSAAESLPAAGMSFEWGPALVTPPELIARIEDIRPVSAGSGARIDDRLVGATRPVDTAPLAIAVATLAARAAAASLPALAPFYIRPADAVPGPSPLREMAETAARRESDATARDSN